MSIFARVLLVVPLLVAGCSAAPPGLDGRAFLSTAVTTNGQAQDLVPGTRIRISFNDGQISISAGCNSMGGSYAVRDGQLLVADLSMTEMGCDPDRHAQDEWVSAFLGSRPSLTLTGNTIELASPGASITLLDREIADPDLPLVGPTWTVVSVISGDAVSSVPAGVVATITFGADGQVGFDNGCNSGGGRYSATAGALKFSELVTTLRACEAAAGAMEAAVMQVLGAETVAYRIEAGTMDLSIGTQGLQLAGS
ncbi:MAG TPA: META domain-containing protein [Candidatus Limnocylindria bacterium]|nr:META domain-containing protein [Candidatus Limnocylindria bacterium]